MLNDISIAEDPNRNRGLQLWAAYLGQLQSEVGAGRQTAVQPQPRRSAELPKTAKIQPTAVFHTATCRCRVCSSGELSTTGSGISAARIIKVKLSGELSDEEQQVLERLQRRDAEVRRHEQAHLHAAGPHALGNPSYTYQVGPDGRRYAIGGEVQIDLSPVEGDPDATLRKALQLQQAALAPANPSAADRQVAAAAGIMAQHALQDLNVQQHERLDGEPEYTAGSLDDNMDASPLDPQLSGSDVTLVSAAPDLPAHGENLHPYQHSSPTVGASAPDGFRSSGLDIFV